MKTKLLLLLMFFSLFGKAQVTAGLIQDYKFYGTPYNEAGDYSQTFFNTQGSPDTFGPDRFAVANKALLVSSGVLYRANFTAPNGQNPRTIAMWVKPLTVGTDNILFSYGASFLPNAVYGASFISTTIYNFTYASNLASTTSIVANNWYHIVITYDSAKNASIYVNGTLRATGSYPAWDTELKNVFYFGNLLGSSTGSFDGYLDDLKIYNRAITSAEVIQLYNAVDSYLDTSEKSVNANEISIYPNPAKDFVNIQSEKKVQSVEIYNMAGQKVLETKEAKINTSNLKSGVYMVKITDDKNQTTSKKLIIK